MQFQVVEQTEFIDDASFQPFKGTFCYLFLVYFSIPLPRDTTLLIMRNNQS